MKQGSEIIELEKALFDLCKDYTEGSKGNWKITLDCIPLAYEHFSVCKAGEKLKQTQISKALTEIQEISRTFPNVFDEY